MFIPRTGSRYSPRPSDRRSSLLGCLGSIAIAACSSSDTGNVPPADTTVPADDGGAPQACVPRLDPGVLHLAAGTTLPPGADLSMCLRWTAPEAIDVNGFSGSLGPLGHHALLLAHAEATQPDGITPCSETDLMDAVALGEFQMLAGIGYESDGKSFRFPSAPVQVGLRIPKGAQLVFDAHFLNPGAGSAAVCTTLDLDRGAPVIAALEFQTILPKEQEGLVVPARGERTVTYGQKAGSRFRVGATSAHLHSGSTGFKMRIEETGVVLYETSSWTELVPRLFPTAVIVEADQTLEIECSFHNGTGQDQRFPEQMCAGVIYALPCTLPGAC